MTKNTIIKKILVFTFLLMVVLVTANSVLAQNTMENLDSSAKEAYTGSKDNELPITMTASLPATIGKIIGTILSYVGLVFLILMIYAGFMWMTARGDDGQAKKAKELIEAAIIGLIIIMSAYAVTSWLGAQVTAK